MPLLALIKKMMKNKIQSILIILCFIFFYTVDITCAFKDSANAKVEMILTAKVSSAIQAPYWIMHRFFHDRHENTQRKF